MKITDTASAQKAIEEIVRCTIFVHRDEENIPTIAVGILFVGMILGIHDPKWSMNLLKMTSDIGGSDAEKKLVKVIVDKYSFGVWNEDDGKFE